MVSVLDLSQELDRRKQTVFKVIRRLGLEVVKHPSAYSRGQMIAYVSAPDADRVRAALRQTTPSAAAGSDVELSPSEAELGHFYLIALEPHHDRGRFKVGFASVLGERIQKHRCSAPLLELVASWPCKRLWEKTAIDAVAYDCERIHTEVFRTAEIELVRERCERFFALMPNVPVRGATGAP